MKKDPRYEITGLKSRPRALGTLNYRRACGVARHAWLIHVTQVFTYLKIQPISAQVIALKGRNLFLQA